MTALIEPVCQASMLRYTGKDARGKNRLLFSNPASTKREKMTVRLSYDEGEDLAHARVLHAGPAAYSVPGRAARQVHRLPLRRGGKSAYETITFAQFTPRVADRRQRSPAEREVISAVRPASNEPGQADEVATTPQAEHFVSFRDLK